MYEKFYNMEELAFKLTPDPRFFFESTEHKRAMAHLTYGLHHGEGFIIITGEVGAGKTTLVDRLLSQIDPTSFVTAKIVTSQLGGDDLLRMVAAAFGLEHSGLPKASLLTGIQDFVVSQMADRRRALLIVDEAQNLSFEALEELRMLSNIVVGRATALQSFLLGQPQFREVLAHRNLDQLRQRVTTAYHLGPLNRGDTRSYIEHRLRRAGWHDDPFFEDDCFSVIYENTEGVPRRINGLCSRLLLYGYLEEIHSISAAATERVAIDLKAELSAVTVPHKGWDAVPMLAESPAFPGAVAKRLDALERMAKTQQRTIQRLIEIMASHFKATGTDEPR
jgi:general secretion pathway protein A